MKRIGYHRKKMLRWKPENGSVIGGVWNLFFENMGLEVKIGKVYGNAWVYGGYGSMSNVLKVLRWEYGMDIRRVRSERVSEGVSDEKVRSGRCCYMLCGMYVDGWKGCNGYIDYMVKEEWEREVKLGVGYGLRGERR